MSAVPKLNHYLTQDTQKIVSNLQWKASLYSLAEKVSWLALCGIATFVLYLSYSGAPLTGTASLLAVGVVLSSAFIAYSLGKISPLRHISSLQAKGESAVLDQLEKKKVKNWTPTQIKNFFIKHDLDVDKVDLNALRKINPTEPLKALLPLIARFLHLHESAHKIERQCLDALAFKIAENLKKSEQTEGEMTPEMRRQHIDIQRDTYYSRLEKFAIPMKFDCAVLLHLIENPTLDLGIKDLGNYVAKDYRERKFDQEYEPQNDDYFIFSEDRQKHALTWGEVIEDTAPKRIKQLLFSNAG